MAFKDKLYGLIDNTGLGKVFSTPAHDPTKARKPLLTGITNTRKQYENGQTKAPNRWWKVSNGVVALTVRVGGETMAINGVPTNHFPAERFNEFMDHFQKAVEAGEFDDELANHGRGDAKVHVSKTGKGSISPEAAKLRGQKAAESRARNKAAREAGNA